MGAGVCDPAQGEPGLTEQEDFPPLPQQSEEYQIDVCTEYINQNQDTIVSPEVGSDRSKPRAAGSQGVSLLLRQSWATVH